MTNSGGLINKAQIQCLAVFSVFAIIGFGPISPGCLIGMFIVDVIYHRYRPAASDAYDCVFHHSRQTGMVLPLNRIDLSNSLND
jgi:hypothetical protein